MRLLPFLITGTLPCAAIYYAPALSDPLWVAGNAWFGPDPESGAALVQPGVAGFAAATAAPRRYGFHATIKPSMPLAGGVEALIAGLREVLADVALFAMPTLRVGVPPTGLRFYTVAHCTPSRPLSYRVPQACDDQASTGVRQDEGRHGAVGEVDAVRGDVVAP